MHHDGDGTADQSTVRDGGLGDSADDPPPSCADRTPAGAPVGQSPIEVHPDAGVLAGDAAGVAGRIATQLQAAADLLGLVVARLCVRLVDDATMIRLHERHCGLDTTTDVLTFCDGGPDEPVDADIACCVDEAARQAAVRDHPVDEELLLYAVHGLLHCIGHDDHDPEAYARMHAEEDRVLAALGVRARFAAGASSNTAVDVTVAAFPAESPGADS
jgi:probable rRNA maturation factor